MRIPVLMIVIQVVVLVLVSSLVPDRLSITVAPLVLSLHGFLWV
jgi:hypothetical protein